MGRKDALKCVKELEKTQWWSVEEIQKIQWKKLNNLLEYAYTTIPYYQQMFKTLSMTPKDIATPDDFRKLPLIDKEDIRNIKELRCQIFLD